MTVAPNTPSFALATQDTEELPNSRTIAAGDGIQIEDTGPGGSLTISVSGSLAAIENLLPSAIGYVVKTGNGTVSTASIVSPTNTIAITNGNGVDGNTAIDVIDGTSIQKSIISLNGVAQGTQQGINFIPGENAGIVIADNPALNAVDVIISSAGGGTPVEASYILQKPDALLPFAQSLSNLETGILKNTTTTGELSIAVAGQDYLAPSQQLTSLQSLSLVTGDLLTSSGSNSVTRLPIGSSGYVLTSVDGSPSWSPASSGNLTAKYVIQEPDSTLPNSFALSSLSSGILKVTASTGVLSTASPGADYLIPNATLNSISNQPPGLGQILYGNSNTAGTYQPLAAGAQGQVLTISSGGIPSWATPASSGAPVNASYILQTENETLTNAQVLASLSTGILKVTTSTGLLSTAVANTDYIAPNSTLSSLYTTLPPLGSIPVGNNGATGTYSHLEVGTAGQILTVVNGSPAWSNPSVTYTASYIIQTPDAALPNAQSLSSLNTGLLKVTTNTGVISTAAPGTDYLVPTTSLNSLGALVVTSGMLIQGNALGGYTAIPIGANGQYLTVQNGQAAWTSLDAPEATARYVLQLPDATMPNAQALSNLSTGIVFVTTETGTLSSLGVGSAGQVLTSNGTSVSWALPSAGPNWSTTPAIQNVNLNQYSISNASSISIGNQSPTPGSYALGIYGGGSSAQVWVGSAPLPTANEIPNGGGVITTYNQWDTSPLVYSNTSGNYFVALQTAQPTTGEILVGNSNGSVSPLSVGSNGQVLTSNGTTATWATPAPYAYTTGPTTLDVNGSLFITDSRITANTIAMAMGYNVETTNFGYGPFNIFINGNTHQMNVQSVNGSTDAGRGVILIVFSW